MIPIHRICAYQHDRHTQTTTDQFKGVRPDRKLLCDMTLPRLIEKVAGCWLHQLKAEQSLPEMRVSR